jgi:hypothetical protein
MFGLLVAVAMSAAVRRINRANMEHVATALEASDNTPLEAQEIASIILDNQKNNFESSSIGCDRMNGNISQEELEIEGELNSLSGEPLILTKEKQHWQKLFKEQCLNVERAMDPLCLLDCVNTTSSKLQPSFVPMADQPQLLLNAPPKIYSRPLINAELLLHTKSKLRRVNQQASRLFITAEAILLVKSKLKPVPDSNKNIVGQPLCHEVILETSMTNLEKTGQEGKLVLLREDGYPVITTEAVQLALSKLRPIPINSGKSAVGSYKQTSDIAFYAASKMKNEPHEKKEDIKVMATSILKLSVAPTRLLITAENIQLAKSKLRTLIEKEVTDVPAISAEAIPMAESLLHPISERIRTISRTVTCANGITCLDSTVTIETERQMKLLKPSMLTISTSPTSQATFGFIQENRFVSASSARLLVINFAASLYKREQSVLSPLATSLLDAPYRSVQIDLISAILILLLFIFLCYTK